jgi:hypothetical protein
MKPSEMTTMFQILEDQKITPNQFYLLFSMREGVSPPGINVHLEHRSLQNDGWIDTSNKLTPKAVDILCKVESYFKVQKKKTLSSLMGDDASARIKEYVELFPNVILPSKKRARSDEKNLETNFKWFFENYKYSWETIIKATAMYVDEYERHTPAFLYMRTSQYFIRKLEGGSGFQSELANYCANLEAGGPIEPKQFSEKVV